MPVGDGSFSESVPYASSGTAARSFGRDGKRLSANIRHSVLENSLEGYSVSIGQPVPSA